MPTPSIPILIPRRFAIRLLHEAQIATTPFLSAVVADQAADSTPNGWMPINEGASVADMQAMLHQHGKRVWALYRHRPELPNPPLAEDFADHPELLRLTASLAIKGVLQLRGWWWLDGAIVEQELDVEA
ncbi:MAG: hypothetical protein QE272_13310 [Nevskia sp.]|nr:hypothetical protein [Gammaproteobacteria bacterium]MDH4459669.1 hypothetical protein [Nevskia sp.]